MPFNPQVPFDPSPNHGKRGDRDIVATVIHFTAGASMRSSILWGKNPASMASWHFIIDRDGSVSQQVELNRAAWHAGQAQVLYRGAMTQAVNACTIGIELCNFGLLQQTTGGFAFDAGTGSLSPYRGPPPVRAALVYPNGVRIEGCWEPFPDAQLDRLRWLLDLLRKNGYDRAAGTLLGHEEVALPPGRKQDPGPAFDWARFGRPDGTRATMVERLTPAVA